MAEPDEVDAVDYIITTKPVNGDQLAAEVGTGVRVSGPEDDGTSKVRIDGYTADDVAAALDGHTADADWVDPTRVTPLTLEERVAAMPDPTVDLAGFRSALLDLLKS